MTVSIIIPCFNQAPFVADAIESALAQQGAPCEVVLVNDGSTDGSERIAARYRGVRIVHQPNRGLSAARNAGLDAARGDIIVFLDADDCLLPGAAAAAVAAFERRPEAAMVFGRCVLVDRLRQPLATNLPRVTADHYRELLRRNYIWMPAMAAFRRGVFDAVGRFDPQVNPSADYDLYLRVARRFPIAAHEGVVAEYRQHGANMSSDPVYMLEHTLRVLRRQRPHITGDAAALEAYRAGHSGWRVFYGERLVGRFRTALHDRRMRAALRDAWRLLRLYPAGVRRHLVKKARLLSGRPGDAGGGNPLRHATRL